MPKDVLKEKVVRLVKDRVIKLDGQRIITFASGDPRHGKLEVMRDVVPLELQLCVPTPAGPRFFLVKIQEKF